MNRYARLGSRRRDSSSARRWLVAFLVIALLIGLVKTWTLVTGRVNPVDQAINTAFTPLVTAARYTAEGFASLRHVFRIPSLLRENQRLKADNAALRRGAAEAELLREANAGLRESLGLRRGDFRTVHAGVVARPYDLWLDQVILGAGSQQGVRQGDLAVNPSGVVGIVDKVSGDVCWVTLITSPRFRLAAVTGQAQCEGVVRGLSANSALRSLANRRKGEEPDRGSLELMHLKANAPVSVGDKVYTSGVSGVDEPNVRRPRGVLIGTVRHRNSDPNGFLEVRIEPSVDTSRLSVVSLLCR